MDSLFQSIEDWLKEVLISGIMDNLSGAFVSVNQQVGQITANVSTSPASFLPNLVKMLLSASCVGPGKSNLPFELRRKAGDCSRVTAGPIDLI